MFQFEFENGLFTLNVTPTFKPLLQLPPQRRNIEPLTNASDICFAFIFVYPGGVLRSPQTPRRLSRFRVFISRGGRHVPVRVRERTVHVERNPDPQAVVATAAPEEEQRAIYKPAAVWNKC